MSDAPSPRRSSCIERILLWPGNKICDLFNIPQDGDSRMLLRLWINLLIYTKFAGWLAYVIYHDT